MNDLAHIDDLIEHQSHGATLTIVHPVTGERMPDMVLTIAGPDSDIARQARLRFQDELYAFSGKPPASELDRIDIERLARLVLSWKVTRDGVPVEFTFTNVVRLLTNAQFVRQQVEAFSQNRAPYFLRLA